jgi:hypothetical protein
MKDETTRVDSGLTEDERWRGRIEEKLDNIISSLSNHLVLRQQDRDEIANLKERVAALEAIPPPNRTELDGLRSRLEALEARGSMNGGAPLGF